MGSVRVSAGRGTGTPRKWSRFLKIQVNYGCRWWWRWVLVTEVVHLYISLQSISISWSGLRLIVVTLPSSYLCYTFYPIQYKTNATGKVEIFIVYIDGVRYIYPNIKTPCTTDLEQTSHKTKAVPSNQRNSRLASDIQHKLSNNKITRQINKQ